MPGEKVQRSTAAFWALVREQHGVVARRQLLALGLAEGAIERRIASGRLHPVWRGVYAVGRPELTRHGTWMAAVLACGPTAALSHGSAAALWEIRSPRLGPIEISIWADSRSRRRGIAVHRRTTLGEGDVTTHRGIPVTTPVAALIDLAARIGRDELEAAINEADKRDLVDPETLRAALAQVSRRPGAPALRRALDRRTFSITDSTLERLFLPIARRAALPKPLTGRKVNGFKVDFLWPELGLVVETDGLRYHRTPAQQAKDRLRDQVHTASGLTCLRFTRAQVKFDPRHVEATLAAVAVRLMASHR